MGGILSGGRAGRGGRPPVSSLPVARLTHAETYSLKYKPVHILTDGTNWCTVVHGRKEWPVELAFTHPHFGGTRRWLCCPECNARRLDLYVKGQRLACRECLSLRYDSNFENRRSRLTRRANNIRKVLGWEPGPLNPNGKKPRWMHASTFKRLEAEHDHIVDVLLCADLEKWIERAKVQFGRVRERAAQIDAT